MSTRPLFLAALPVLLPLVACDGATGPVTITIGSEPALDGSVDSQGVVDASSPEMEIGRNAQGYGVRGFLAFDVADLVPQAGETIEIVSADLSVYENNFNLLPWDTMGNAFLEIVDHGASLDAADFDTDPLVDAGVASSGSNFLDYHELSVGLAVQQFFDEGVSDSWLQFRIRFVDDSDTEDATLSDNHWDLNTAEATEPPDSGPEITIVYEIIEEG